MRSSSIAVSFLALAAACRSAPPVELHRSLVVAPTLRAANPSDVAVLPVVDDSPTRALEPHAEVLRGSLAAALAQKLYAPLSPAHVDARVDRQRLGAGSPVDASFVAGFAGRFDEDAMLGVRVTRWDERSIMENARVSFAAEVLMVSRDGAVLWSGRVDGSVKAGGEGPAPISRDGRSRSAVEVFGRALIEELPARTRG